MIKYCTGERYKGEFNNLAMIEGWHGLFGHLNVLVRDHDSVITGHGRHERVVCFQPSPNGELYCRVDHIWSLPEPTIDQTLNVARLDQGVKGKWRVVSVITEEPLNDKQYKVTHITFRR